MLDRIKKKNVEFRDSPILVCHCADSCFLDKEHGHTAEDLRIIDKNKLSDLGSNFRESMSAKFQETRSDVILKVH